MPSNSLLKNYFTSQIKYWALTIQYMKKILNTDWLTKIILCCFNNNTLMKQSG